MEGTYAAQLPMGPLLAPGISEPMLLAAAAQPSKKAAVSASPPALFSCFQSFLPLVLPRGLP